MKKTLIIWTSIALLGFFSGCEDYLDINDDPNNPTDAPLNQLLTSVAVDYAGVLGTSSGGLSQITLSYLHQIVQRGNTINDYGINGDDFGVSTPWLVWHTRAFTDLEIIIDKGRAQENWHYVAIAQILKAYMASVMVDIWGDVPWSEAAKGTAILNPKYDDGAQVYENAFALLDSGLKNIARPVELGPAADDLFYQGDMDKWRRLAKTIQLKLYNQVRMVQDVSADVTALINEGDLLQDMTDDFELQYGTSISPDNRNPGYIQEYLNPTYYVSPFFYEIMTGKATFFPTEDNPLFGVNSDPRIPYYFYNMLQPQEQPENEPSYWEPSTGFLSIYAFSFNIDPNEGFDQSSSQTTLGLYPLGGAYDNGAGTTVSYAIGAADTPQRILTYFALKYIEAELALTGEGPGDARTLFEEAMAASFAKVNQVANAASAPLIPDADIDAYIADVLTLYDNADDEGKLQLIMTEKWIASFGYGVDMYTDYRRTGYPVLHDGNTDNLSVTVRGRNFPFSFPWPNNNLAVNSSAPTQKRVATDEARVFWDVN